MKLTFKHNLQRGFTLLEVIVVILIIGIASSAVLITTSKPDPLELAKDRAWKFHHWFTKLQETSLIENREFGLYFLESSVVVLNWEEQESDTDETEIVWEETDKFTFDKDGESLDVELIVDIESRQWILLAEELNTEEEPVQPHIILLPSEEYFPSFRFKLSAKNYSDEAMLIVGDGFNQPEVSREAF